MTERRSASLLWFLGHDLRLSLRAFESRFAGRSRFRVAAILVGGVVVAHLLAWPFALRLVALTENPDADARIEVWVGLGMAVGLSMILAQAMIAAMRTLYARADLDLIFASPVSPRTVLASRALAVAFEAASTGAIAILPIANMSALLGQPRWLALYPALLAAALLAAGVGLLFAMGLFAAFGPRKARTLAQVGATLVGASFVLTAQTVSLLPEKVRAALTDAVINPAPGSWLDHRGAVWLPARAALGEPRASIEWLALGLAVFALAVAISARRFVGVAALTAGISTAPVRHGVDRAFRGGVGAALRRKERKLIARDPWLLSQILLQIIYAVPVTIVLWRTGGPTSSTGVAVAPSIVIIAAQLSGSLAWVTLSGEDAPEFLAAAPITKTEIAWQKLRAIAVPIAALLAAPILSLAYFSPRGAIFAAVFSVGAGASTALLNLWRQVPAKRTMVLRRHSQSRLVGMIELLLTLLWAVACGGGVMNGWLAVPPLVLVALVLWAIKPRRVRPARAPAPRAARGATTAGLP